MTTFSTEQILQSSTGSLIKPPAEFWARVAKVEPKLSQPKEDGSGGGKAFLQVTWQVLDGEYEGLDAVKTYWLSINKRQDGAPSAKSLLELLMDCKAIGHPFPANHEFKETPTLDDATAIGKIVAAAFKPAVTPRFRLKAVYEAVREQVGGRWVDARDENGELKKRVKFVVLPAAPSAGVATANVAAAPPQPAATPSAGAPAPVDPLSLV
ncbi:MAG: hypothetical protein KGL39_09175 [Patescibacteria group bacterium]|nr:hypothetical protein [Patescibacteria group bacterium]